MALSVSRDQRFSALYVEHQPDVLVFFLRRLGRDDAVEAAADVFVTAWRRLDDIPEGHEARLWLFGVARNVLRNRERSARRWRRLNARLWSLSGETQPSPEVVVVQRAEDLAIHEALDRLSSGDREVIRLRLWDELPFGDIGNLLGCSRHAAEQRYAKALRRLRSAAGRSGHGEGMGPLGPKRQEQLREPR